MLITYRNGFSSAASGKLYRRASVAWPDSWMYSVRTHCLRKYFRTQMSASKIDSEIIKYFMGKTIDTYEDVQA